MRRYNKPHKLTKKNLFLHSSLLFLTIVLIVLQVPRTRSVSYHYDCEIGKPWEGEAVFSPDSFFVPMPEARMKERRDSINRYYEVYYERDAKVQEVVERAIADSLRRYSEGALRAPVRNALRDYYAKGVMDDAVHARLLRANPNREVNIYSGKQSTTRTIADVKTVTDLCNTLLSIPQIADCPNNKQWLAQCVKANLRHDDKKSAEERDAAQEKLAQYIGKVAVGQKIVDRGDKVDEFCYQALRELEKIHAGDRLTNAQYFIRLGGQSLFVAIMVLLFYAYFRIFRSDYVVRGRTMSLVALLSIIFISLSFLMVKNHWLNVFLLPYCIQPIILRIFLDSRTAFVAHLFTVLISSVCLTHPFEFILVEAVAGLTAIYSLSQLSRRSDLVRAVLFVGAASVLTNQSLHMMHGKFFDDYTLSVYLLISCLLSLVVYLLLIPIERLFGFTSTVTLVELGDINSPLMRALSENAPGTFQHSMQVANLAAAAAYSIGAQSQLVRTGALYHDIGKLKDPECFTENQSGYSPHSQMTCLESASAIISHVTYGLKLADKYRLPKVIREFISTHHGEGMARYFYITYQNEHPDETIDPKPFTYPGPDPFTNEQALLMMADGVEAASRSLSEYTEESISGLVNKIVDGLLREGRFNHCPMTLRDIDDVKRVFCEKLKTIYHTRVKYPELKK